MLNKDKTSLMGILEAIENIEEYTSPFISADDFFQNKVNYDAVMMNFIIIGEMVDRLSGHLKEKHNYINWNKIKGVRNLIAHDYFGIDAEEIFQIAKSQIKKLKLEVMNILDNLNS
ncbi:MAG: DUF86 domain-containing protein [Candidatus Latescibacter sp.]|nr:DUF86 domain-containing protein [Candidatus Latescibacter sp.]